MTAARTTDFEPPLAWSQLPAGARRLLLHGSVCGAHLREVAGIVLGHAAAPEVDPAQRKRLLALAQDMLLAAWTGSPLDGGVAALLLANPGDARQGLAWPALPVPVDNLLRAQVNFWSPPPPEHSWWSLPAGEEQAAVLRERLFAEPKNLFWKRAAWDYAWPRAEWWLVEALLEEGQWPRTLAPLRHRFAAQAYLAMGDPFRALASLNAAPALAEHVGDACMRSESLARIGRAVGEEEAARVLRRSLSRSPWRTSQWLRLSDLMSATSRARRALPGSVAVLLYTYNKAAELDETLAALAASDAAEARVFVLNNGCTDATARVLAAWSERLGERLSLVTLPVNVGAPAARNWLLSLPEVRALDFVAFLDDDAIVPADWLSRLGEGVGAYPEASVWGCRVVDDANPLVLQSVDISPLPPHVPPGPGDLPLALPQLHTHLPDFGQFSYLRPCVSVTGCCHLLRTADIDRTGGFDIRFSPTQYDDLERDLRLGFGGGFAVYQGHLRVRHKRRSGAAAERNHAAEGNATANTHKLLTKHAASEFERLRARAEERLEADLTKRMERCVKESV